MRRSSPRSLRTAWDSRRSAVSLHGAVSNELACRVRVRVRVSVRVRGRVRVRVRVRVSSEQAAPQ